MKHDSSEQIQETVAGFSDTDTIESLAEKSLKQDIELKRKIAKWGQWLVSCYLVAVAVILAHSALTREIADSVLIALLTTTTVNVLGLSYLVVRHLFPEGRKNC